MIAKDVNIGTIESHTGKRWNVFAQIQFDGRKLSICGVEGPWANGDAFGSCGQCLDTIVNDESFVPTPGIDAGRLHEVWKTWHLNDMQPACEHQRANPEWDTSEEIEFCEWSIEWDTERKLKQDYRKQCEAHGMWKAGQARGDYKRSVKYSPSAALLWAFSVWGIKPFAWKAKPSEVDTMRVLRQADRYCDTDPISLLKIRTQRKKAGWIREDEHPKGLLCKPCPECGYKYGSAWLQEDIPADVIAFLESLPNDSESVPYCWRTKSA